MTTEEIRKQFIVFWSQDNDDKDMMNKAVASFLAIHVEIAAQLADLNKLLRTKSLGVSILETPEHPADGRR